MNTKTQTLTKSELAKRYKIHVNTLREWLSRVPDLDLTRFQKVLTPKQLIKIYEHLGEP